jgi:hypothetical protein
VEGRIMTARQQALKDISSDIAQERRFNPNARNYVHKHSQLKKALEVLRSEEFQELKRTILCG